MSENSNPAIVVLRPVIHVDWNVPSRPIPGNGDYWQLAPGQEVILDDKEGLRARGRFSHWLGPTEHAPNNRLAFFDVVDDSFEHYEREAPDA